MNLRGTGYASRHTELREFSARVDDVALTVEVNVAGLAGFRLAKTAAAYSRRKPKDWYDIALAPIPPLPKTPLHMYPIDHDS